MTTEHLKRMPTKGTTPELQALEAITRSLPKGVRVETNVKNLPGSPDLVLRVAKIAVFVHGCFWHACPRHANVPGTDPLFWLEKFRRNNARDRRVAKALRSMDWSVVTVWECQSMERFASRVERMVRRKVLLS